MKIMVSGAGGQLGQDVVNQSRARGYDTLPYTSGALDITDSAAVHEIVTRNRPHAIINCAAYTVVDQAERDWKRAFMVNGLGVRNLALAARTCDAILVHYSTDYVFDGQVQRPYTVVDHPRPISRYGESKLLGEQMVQNHASRYFLIRTSWVFGTGNTNFARKVLEWSREKSELKVVDDQIASPTYTFDLARATLDLIKTEAYGLYHITNSGSCSRYAWARYILDATGWNGTILPAKSAEFPTPARRPAYSVLDNFGFPEIVGYSLPPWEESCRVYLNAMKAIP